LEKSGVKKQKIGVKKIGVKNKIGVIKGRPIDKG